MYVDNLYVGRSSRKGSLRLRGPRRGSHMYRAPRRSLNLGSLIPVAGVLLALFLVVSLVGKACSACFGGPDWVGSIVQTAQEERQAMEPDFSKLPEGLDKATVKGLEERKDDGRIAWIVNNADALTVNGAERQAQYLKLAADDPAAADFVYELPSRYPAKKGEPYTDPVVKGTVPLLMQWDQRWGYTEYCGAAFGTTGCCPTTLSMVYMGLTGKTDKTPYDIAAIAEKGGYAYDGEGTVSSFVPDAASRLGLGCEEFLPDSSMLLDYLSQGYPVIVNVGPGDFTTSGHFIVATGLDQDGKVVVNDPYSTVRSDKTWSADKIANQAITMWAFYN